jgi:4-diphosphocytidyl-2-C-methyl-D-erythritol kinase
VTLVLRASAKINLSLRIAGRRPDGFHELRTVFQTLALADVITVRRVRGAFRLEGSATDVPLDQTNLVWRGAVAAWRAAGGRGPVRAVSVTLQKRIPTAAGLGGGSSDAAATLVGVNRVLGLGLGPAELHQAAASLGSDVPFFLVGGTALGLGRGEDLFPLPDLPRLFVVLARPSFGVSTADAYRWYAESAEGGQTPARRNAERDRRNSNRGQTQVGQTPLGGQTLVVPWRADSLELVNDLERAVLPRFPPIAAARRALLRQGALAALMAGSGSTVFGLFEDARQARRAAAALARPAWTVRVTRTLSRSAHRRRLAGTSPA